jgi:predicted nucleic acid-binding protein
MADAVVYATAKASNAKLATSDQHFKDLDGVMFI